MHAISLEGLSVCHRSASNSGHAAGRSKSRRVSLSGSLCRQWMLVTMSVMMRGACTTQMTLTLSQVLQR